MTPHQPHAFAKLASPCLIRQLIMRRGWVIGGAGILVLVALMGWSRWRGEAVSVLQVQQRPLEQWVVASGQVRSQSLARMGAEITGTVAQRHGARWRVTAQPDHGCVVVCEWPGAA